jgi:hypothetical protein
MHANKAQKEANTAHNPAQKSANLDFCLEGTLKVVAKPQKSMGNCKMPDSMPDRLAE